MIIGLGSGFHLWLNTIGFGCLLIGSVLGFIIAQLSPHQNAINPFCGLILGCIGQLIVVTGAGTVAGELVSALYGGYLSIVGIGILMGSYFEDWRSSQICNLLNLSPISLMSSKNTVVR